MVRRIINIFLSTIVVVVGVTALLFVLMALDLIERETFEEVFEKVWKVSLIVFIATSLISLVGQLKSSNR